MIEIKYCPSTLAEGYDIYSPQAVKRLFDGKRVSPFLDFNINELKQSDVIVRAMQRISVSGVLEKFSGVIDGNMIRIAESRERSTYIIKPAPWDETISTRKQIPANEHVTMQIARQVYGIVTAENGLCFTKDGQAIRTFRPSCGALNQKRQTMHCCSPEYVCEAVLPHWSPYNQQYSETRQ